MGTLGEAFQQKVLSGKGGWEVERMKSEIPEGLISSESSLFGLSVSLEQGSNMIRVILLKDFSVWRIPCQNRLL